MTAQEFLRQYHDDNPNDWLYQKRQVLVKLLNAYASQQRTEGIKEGFTAARQGGIHKRTYEGVGEVSVYGNLYPTADDYINSKRGY